MNFEFFNMISPVKIWRRQKEIRKILGKKGKILTWTKIYTSSSDFKHQAPYFVVLVEFEDGEKAFGQLVEVEKKEIKIGMPVISILRKVRKVGEEDVLPYGVKFKLIN